MLDRKVSDFLKKPLITVEEDMSLRDTARVMRNEGISGLLVVSGEGMPVGVVSDTDMVRALSRGVSRDTRVGEIMSRSFFGVSPEATLREAARLMRENGVSRLFVVKGAEGRTELSHMPEGIISISDIISAVAGRGLSFK
ncbi:MAG: CBS domain-containing protein [Euryarchaeota archaeon]|nr:CBS domain-containing protein [Euryarchaeota archaeon]